MSIVILRLKVTQFVLFGMSLGRGVISRLGTGPITCGDLVNDIGAIRAGRTGGSSMDELCYVLVERPARLELGGYGSVVWHAVLEAFASGTR